MPLAAVAVAGSLLGATDGGYYIAQWGIAALLVLVLLVSLLAVGPAPVTRLPPVSKLGLGALLGYAAWSAVAVSWAPDLTQAWHEASRTIMYCAVVVAVVLLARMPHAPLRPTLIAVVAIPTAVTIAMITNLVDDRETLFYLGRLLGSVGYFNAVAAYLLLAFWPGLWVALDRSLPHLLRGAALGAITLMAGTSVLAQSRGSLVSFAVASVVFLAMSPARLRALLPMAMSVALVVWSLPELNAVYQSLSEAGDVASQATRNATERAIAIALIATVAGTVWALVDSHVGRWWQSRNRPRWLTAAKTAGAAATVVIVLGGVVFAVQKYGLQEQAQSKLAQLGGPVVEEKGGGPSRLTSVSNNGRFRLWSTALDAARHDPVHGLGPGGFETYNYRTRDYRGAYVKQPHNLTLEVLSERGFVGAALFLLFLTSVGVRVVQWRVGARSAATKTVVAALAAVFAQWLAHAQLEWFWQFAAVTWLPFVAAGLLLSPCWGTSASARTQAHRSSFAHVMVRLAGAGTALAAIAFVTPPFLADRYVEQSRQLLAANAPGDALVAVRRAERLNPHSVDAARQRFAIASKRNDRQEAREALRDMIARSPQHWAPYMIASSYYDRLGDVATADDYRKQARRLNPNGYDFDADKAGDKLPVDDQDAAAE